MIKGFSPPQSHVHRVCNLEIVFFSGGLSPNMSSLSGEEEDVTFLRNLSILSFGR